MPTFGYIARDLGGTRVEGKLTGASPQAVLAELQSRQLAPVEVKELRDATPMIRGVSGRQLAAMYRQMADLIRAGVPLLRALRLIARGKANPRLARVMSQVADAVAEGARLADAMALHADVFPPVQVAMVRAGERGGFLEPVLSRMGLFLEHQAEMRSKVVGNLIYPCVLLLIGLGIIAFAMVFFVPRFKGFYERIELPWPTSLLLGVSDLLSRGWLIGVVLIGVCGLVAWRLFKRREVRRALAIAQIRAPVLGPLIRSVAVGRFTRILGTLLENGIPMLQAMQIARDAAGNLLLAEAIDQAGEAVRSGETLARPLADCGLFGEDVIEMISVGESANNLPTVLISVAETIEKRTDRLLGMFIRLIEPALLLGLAGVVLFIFVALIVPMMRMSSSLSG